MREIRQKEAVQAYLESDGKTIINACPRFGKIKVAVDIMREKGYKQPLIIAPRTDIFKGWEDDFNRWKYIGSPVFSTFKSIKKITGHSFGLYDFLIIDEPHELSQNQQATLIPIVEKLPTLGLTGTMTQKTRTELYDSLTLDVCYKYTIAEGVRDGILTDYQLLIHKVDLDKEEKKEFGKWKYLRNNSKGNSLQKHFFDLKMINILQNSTAKGRKAKRLIEEFKDDRLLVFCGVTRIADSLGIPVYHSKNGEKRLFEEFCRGEGQHLATIKMMQAGITVSPIHKGIINYMSGNPEDSAQKICRFLGLEYANLDKKAEIHIICSNEDFETIRLKTGLIFFESDKIKYI